MKRTPSIRSLGAAARRPGFARGALLALALLAGPAAGAPDGARHLERWPEPRDRAQLENDALRLRAARTEAMEREARAALLAEGAAAVPALLEALRREREPAARGRVLAVLEQLTTGEHTRLLARRFDDKSDAVRRFVLARVAAFPDPGVREQAEAARERALSALAAEGEPKEAELEALREELYLASLCCASAGSAAGLRELLARAQLDWNGSGGALRTALAGARGTDAGDRLLAELASADRAVVIAALRLLAVCGAREEAPARIRPFLDHTDNVVRIAAINALRGIVDGEPPLENLPVFEAIELASAWKRRL